MSPRCRGVVCRGLVGARRALSGATGLTGGSLGAHSGLTGEVARLQMRHAQAVAVLDIEVYLE